MDDAELSSLFCKISKGKIKRVSLELAITTLTNYFKKKQCIQSQVPLCEIINDIYQRKMDTLSGTNAHALMAGGPKYINGNSGGCLHSKVFFPLITFEQFRVYAKIS